MKKLSVQDWLERETDYREDMSSEDMALKYGVSRSTVSSWSREKHWTRSGPPSRLLQIKLMRVFDQAEQHLVVGETTQADALLKTIAAMLKNWSAIQDIWSCDPLKESVKQDMNDKPKNRDEERSFEELKDELRRDLMRKFGLETKSDVDGSHRADPDQRSDLEN